jgi:ATP-dependent protease ClpP protease subunit
VNTASLHGGRTPVRLPLSPVRAEMALKALQAWREPEVEGREKRWFRVENAEDGDGPTQINIFDEISWWGITAQEFVDELAGIKGDVEIHINSPGGNAFDGITIYNAIRSRTGGVTTVVDGLAASAASVIFMAGKSRVASPGSMVMIHDALALCIGNAADMRETAALLDKVSGNIADIYAAHAGKTSAEWRDAMVGEAWYTAREAVAAGLAHKLAETAEGEPGPEGAAARWDQSVFAAWQGRVSNSDVDESDWDGPAAMSRAGNSDNPEAAFRAICAGEKTVGEPDQRQHWALPHHKNKGDPPNRHGVNNAMSRLDSTQDLKNKAAAEAHLKAHQSAMGGGSSDSSAASNGHTHTTPDEWDWDDEAIETIQAALKGASQ